MTFQSRAVSHFHVGVLIRDKLEVSWNDMSNMINLKQDPPKKHDLKYIISTKSMLSSYVREQVPSFVSAHGSQR